MARFLKISLCLLLLVGLLHSTSGGKKKGMAKKVLKALGNMPGILGQAFELWQTFESVYDIFSPKPDAPSTDDRLDALNEKMDRLSSDLQAFEGRLNDKLEDMQLTDTLGNGLEKLFKSIDFIETYYSQFSDYTNESLVFLEEDMEGLVNEVLHSSYGVDKILGDMHSAFRSTDGVRKNIPMLLIVPSVAQKFMCALQQSAQQYIHTLYQKMMLAEVKGYALLIYANEYRREANGAKKTSHNLRTRNPFENRTSQTFDIVKKAMSAASRELWRCDSGRLRDTDYTKVGPVFQKFVLYEGHAWNASNDEEIGCATKGCPVFNHVKHKCKGEHCGPQYTCQGNVRDCEHKGNHISYCIAEDGYRRYNYIKYDDKVFGEETECPSNKAFNDDPIRRTFVYCYYCLCTCENHIPSIDKYVSLRPVMSGHRHNKVVTGARIRVINNVFHIQIKQGKLLPNGRVEADNWKRVENFTVRDKDVQKDKDYYEITWNSNKVLLDDLDSSLSQYEKHHIVTGFQFQKVNDQIKLAVYISRFNYTTGLLMQNNKNPKLLTSEHDADQRALLPLNDLDLPDKFENNHQRSQKNQYIQFTTSDLKKDAGQNVIPFIDIQSVATNPPSPLSGAGLFLRDDDKHESGGLLALKLFTLNTVPYMKTPKIAKKPGARSG